MSADLMQGLSTASPVTLQVQSFLPDHLFNGAEPLVAGLAMPAVAGVAGSGGPCTLVPLSRGLSNWGNA